MTPSEFIAWLSDSSAGYGWILWVIVPLFGLAFGVVYLFERDARRSSQRVAGGMAGFVVMVVAVLTGIAEGFAGVGSGVLDVLAPHADFIAQIGLAVAGWSAVSGGVMDSLTTFGVFAVALIVVAAIWGH